MKKKRLKKDPPVVPGGMVPLVNGEAARRGTAVLAQNVRECEQSLQVTGSPAVVGAIGVGERLLLLADGHRVTGDGNTVKIDDVAVASVQGEIVGAHVIGEVIVIVTDAGMTYLRQHDGAWTVMDPAAAVPLVALQEQTATHTAAVPAYTFAEPYQQWRAPLTTADVMGLTALMRATWTAAMADITAMGRYSAPLLARWAVRLQDDSYLWMSEPVRLGDATLSNADRVTALVESGSAGFTGTEATTWPLTHYSLDIAVTRDIAPEWLPLVKSIDVLVTREATLLSSAQTLGYRCLTRTTGNREQVLEMGLSRRSSAAIAQELADSPWHLVATAPAAAHLTGSDFVAPSAPLTMTAQQCASVGLLPSLRGVVCWTAAAGRLYLCTRDGDVVVSAPGNALVEAHRRSVLGAVPLAIAVVTRPLYSNGFGRYPVYVFSDDGIYAIAQNLTGVLGEARLVDRTVIAAGVAPVEAWRDVWFVSRHGHLCRLSGPQVNIVEREADYQVMAWCNAYSELWLLPPEGSPRVMMASGAMSERTVDADQLYSDPRHAVAVTGDGTLLDLEREQEASMPVVWRSHSIVLNPLLGASLGRVVWHVSGQAVDMTLKVVGQRGIMAQERDVSVTTVAGDIDQPLATAPVRWPVRSLRLAVTGTARSSTLLLPTIIYTHQST